MVADGHFAGVGAVDGVMGFLGIATGGLVDRRGSGRGAADRGQAWSKSPLITWMALEGSAASSSSSGIPALRSR